MAPDAPSTTMIDFTLTRGAAELRTRLGALGVAVAEGGGVGGMAVAVSVGSTSVGRPNKGAMAMIGAEVAAGSAVGTGVAVGIGVGLTNAIRAGLGAAAGPWANMTSTGDGIR